MIQPEKEWLKTYSDLIWNQNGKHTHNELDEILLKLIAEATRRGKLAAWVDAKKLMKQCLNHVINDPFIEGVFNEHIQQYGKDE